MVVNNECGCSFASSLRSLAFSVFDVRPLHPFLGLVDMRWKRPGRCGSPNGMSKATTPDRTTCAGCDLYSSSCPTPSCAQILTVHVSGMSSSPGPPLCAQIPIALFMILFAIAYGMDPSVQLPICCFGLMRGYLSSCLPPYATSQSHVLFAGRSWFQLSSCAQPPFNQELGSPAMLCCKPSISICGTAHSHSLGRP